MPKAVRVVAVAIVRRPSDGAILVSEGSDAGGSTFQRPLGGTDEFGERATETVEREFLEELGVRVRPSAMRGVLENLFTLDGSMGHESRLRRRGDLRRSLPVRGGGASSTRSAGEREQGALAAIGR